MELSIGLASATMLRGVTLGAGSIDAQAVAAYADARGWRVALGAGALHDDARHGRWDAQVFGRAGYAGSLGGDWTGQVALARFHYPGSASLRRYARDELGATLAWRDRLYVSASALRQRRAPDEAGNSLALDVVVRQALPHAFGASAGVGRVAVRGTGFAYVYGHVALAARSGAALAQIAYVAADASARERFGAAAAPRWTASLTWDF